MHIVRHNHAVLVLTIQQWLIGSSEGKEDDAVSTYDHLYFKQNTAS